MNAAERQRLRAKMRARARKAKEPAPIPPPQPDKSLEALRERLESTPVQDLRPWYQQAYEDSPGLGMVLQWLFDVLQPEGPDEGLDPEWAGAT